MNLFRIVQKRTNKRKEKSSPYRDVIAALLFVFLLPYVICALMGHIGEETDILHQKKETKTVLLDEKYEVGIYADWGTRKLSMQEYLIRKLQLVMALDEENVLSYEPEALKAQAVLLRTELWRMMSDTEGLLTIQDNAVLHYETEALKEDAEESYEKAVLDTDGIILVYNDEPIKAAYFPVSNGKTRDAAEIWPGNNYPYLVSVECSQDITSPKYQSRVRLTREEYCEQIGDLFGTDAMMQVLWDSPVFTYDSAGYVTEAEFQGNICSGEIFRNAFGLESASFRMEREEDAVIFHVKGVGHGLGMSQYGANEKAVSKEKFDEILKDYFFQTEIVKIE